MSRHVLRYIFLFYFVFLFFFFIVRSDVWGIICHLLSSPGTPTAMYFLRSIQVWTTRPCGHRPILRSIFIFTIIIIINVIIRIDRNTRRFDPEILLVWGHQHRRIIETDFLSATEYRRKYDILPPKFYPA